MLAEQEQFGHVAKDLEESLKTLPKQTANQLSETVSALYFIDQRHSFKDLLELFNNTKRLEEIRIATKYDTPGAHNMPKLANMPNVKIVSSANEERAFDNYIQAQGYLKSAEKQELSMDMILKTHELATQDSGAIRKISVVSGGNPMSESEIRMINDNPYVSYNHESHNQPGMQTRLMYPTAKRLKNEAIRRLAAEDRELVKEVLSTTGSTDPKLTFKVVKALLNERIKWFLSKRSRIGPLNNPHAKDQYIALVAEFQRDFVSIHPFEDGNGRVSRLIMNFLLEREGIPPARLFEPENDLAVPMSEWIDQVRLGVVATKRLYQDLAQRIKLGLPLENSPELLTPYLPRDGAGNVQGNLDAKQFATWLYLNLKAVPSFINGVRPANAGLINKAIYHKFLEFMKAKHGFYLDQHQVKKVVQLSLIDRDFAASFGKIWATDPVKWKNKMALWYQNDQLMFTGVNDLSNGSHSGSLSERNVLDMFTKVNPETGSSNLRNTRNIKEAQKDFVLAEIVRQDFANYNNDLMTKGISDAATVHTLGEHGNGSGYGFFATTDQKMAKDLAIKGGKRGVSDTIVIGMRRAKKDVELNTLGSVERNYQAGISRPREIMGIGAADPDSIMVIQRIGVDGKVLQSWVRNSESPAQIWVVRGEYYPKSGEVPGKDILIRTEALSDHPESSQEPDGFISKIKKAFRKK